MSEVVEFPKQQHDLRDILLQCGCGCQSFYALCSGEIQCTDCENIPDVDTSMWVRPMPDLAAVPQATERRVVNCLGSDQLAIQRVLRQDLTGLKAIITIFENSRVTLWSEKPKGKAQREWFKKRLNDALAMMLGKESEKINGKR